MKVFQYVALMSKGRIESDKDQVFKYLVENLKSSCDVITDLIQIDLCKSDFYIKNCTKFTILDISKRISSNKTRIKTITF